MKLSRAVPATSSLPLQVALYFNIIFAFIFFIFQVSVHIHKVQGCELLRSCCLVPSCPAFACIPQRYTFIYDMYMRILIPIFIAAYAVCEIFRVYLGYSGNLLEKVGV